nr:MAG TPA: antitoxin [Caudoviricetes sp.]
MTIIDLYNRTGMSQIEFSRRFDIPYRTVQDWLVQKRTPPNYVIKLLEYYLINENLLKK